MKRTQIIRVNHLSKNGVIIADDTDTVISECRQKQQDNQNKPRKQKEPNKSFYQYMKKDQNQTKTYIVIIALENHFQTIQIILGINHHITLVIEVDQPNKEFHEISHKTDTIDRTVETTIHDQIQTQIPLELSIN